MAGAGYKLFNTGDVLTAAQVNTYLQEQTVMVFASSTARTTALSGVLAEGMVSYLQDTNAVEVYNGSAWVSLAADQTPLTTKGDLFTFSTVDARLAAGSNGDNLFVDSSATTGLRWQGNYSAGKNAIINGDFRINQRAFSSTTTTGTYGFDRWSMQLSGATGTYSAETFTLGAAPVAGYEANNFARLAITTGNDNASLQNRMESVRTFAGQTVTVSFWAKGTNPATEGGLYTQLSQVFGAGGSPSAAVTVTGTKFVLTANWTRYSFTLNVPSISGKTLGTTAGTDYLALVIGQGASTSTDAWTLDLWGVQVESGNVATAFQTATGTLAGELAACQRYYYRNTPGTTYGAFGLGQCVSTDQARIPINLPVTMRTNVATLDYANVGATNNTDAVVTAPSSLTIGYSGSNVVLLSFAATGAFAGAGNSTVFRANNSTTAYLAFSAEL